MVISPLKRSFKRAAGSTLAVFFVALGRGARSDLDNALAMFDGDVADVGAPFSTTHRTSWPSSITRARSDRTARCGAGEVINPDPTTWVCAGSSGLNGNLCGILGSGSTEWRDAGPGMVIGMHDVEHVTVGQYFACALTKDKTAYCWGASDYTASTDPNVYDPKTGKEPGNTCWLGTFYPSPVRVEGLPPVRRLSVGSHHACAIDFDEQVWCWGVNTKGELGVEPKLVTELRPFPARVEF